MIDTALECSENEPDSAARAQLILAAIGHTVRYPIDMGGVVRGGDRTEDTMRIPLFGHVLISANITTRGGKYSYFAWMRVETDGLTCHISPLLP